MSEDTRWLLITFGFIGASIVFLHLYYTHWLPRIMRRRFCDKGLHQSTGDIWWVCDSCGSSAPTCTKRHNAKVSWTPVTRWSDACFVPEARCCEHNTKPSARLTVRSTMKEPDEMAQTADARRFGLSDGQYFAEYRYKNLWWELHDHSDHGYPEVRNIGFGDLTDSQINHIAQTIRVTEEFVGWNEHHGSATQQTSTPMVRIRRDSIKLREDIVAEEGH